MLDDQELVADKLVTFLPVRCRCEPTGRAAVALASEVADGLSDTETAGRQFGAVVSGSCNGEINGQCQFVRKTKEPIEDEIISLVHQVRRISVR